MFMKYPRRCERSSDKMVISITTDRGLALPCLPPLSLYSSPSLHYALSLLFLHLSQVISLFHARARAHTHTLSSSLPLFLLLSQYVKFTPSHSLLILMRLGIELESAIWSKNSFGNSSGMGGGTRIHTLFADEILWKLGALFEKPRKAPVLYNWIVQMTTQSHRRKLFESM